MGVPVKSLSKYLNSLKVNKLSYIVYKDINGDLIVEEFNVENLNKEIFYNLGCENCKNATYHYEKEEIRKILS